MKQLCLYTFLFCIALKPQAQVAQFNFKRLNSNSGLSDGAIYAFTQDKYGLMWIGTAYGLNRFDGVNIKTFFSKASDSSSITNNYIHSLYTDKQGNLWVGTLQGLCKFNYNTGTFIRYNTKAPADIIKIMQDGDGKIWAGTAYGFMLVDEKKKVLEKFIVPGDKDKNAFSFAVRDIAADANGNWYIASQRGIKIFNPITHSLSEIKNDPANKASLSFDYVNSVCLDAAGNLWAATGYNGSVLDKINLASHTVTHFTHFTDTSKKWNNNTILKLMIDKTGKLWATSNLSGVSVYDEGSNTFHDYLNDPLLQSSIISNSVVVIYQDKEGIIWAGTSGYGLSYFNPAKNFFSVIYPFAETGTQLTEAWCRTSCEDGQGNLWLGTGNGLIKYNRSSGTFTKLVNSNGKKDVLQDNSIRALQQDDDGNIWIGTAKGLNRYHPLTGVMDFFDSQQGMPAAFFWMIVKDKNGTIWLGTASGLYRYVKGSDHFDDLSKDTVLHAYAHRNIQAMYADSHNRLWIGILDVGMVMYDVTQQQQKLLTIKDSLITDTRFSSCAEDHNGNIWIGSESGLTVYDAVSNHSHFFSREDGLPSDRTNNIMVDDFNRVWLGTSNGLCMLSADRKVFKRFDANDGLPTNQFNEQSAYRTTDGLLVYPTYKGFVYFSPEKIGREKTEVQPLITSFKIKGKEISEPAEAIAEIKLGYNENFFSIDLAGLNYINPFECTYAYKLEPFDKDWIYTKERKINYTNVPGGSYTFRYKASLNDTAWNVPEKTIRIFIGTVFYKTWWFLTLMSLLGITVIYLFYRWRMREGEKLMLLQNKAYSLEKEKAKVMYESLKQQLNPHFLFNSLTSLSSLITSNPANAKKFLERLSKIYRYILKSRDSETVSLREEINLAETYIQLQQTRFKEGLHFEVTVPEEYLHKKIAPVTLQNLVENAIKHNIIDVATPLTITIFTTGEWLIIQNNLQKKEFVETSNKQGLENMQSLYYYLSGKKIVITEDDKFFTVKIPLL